MIQPDLQGLSSIHFHAYMLGGLIFSSLRWITIKYAGENVTTSAMIFWEPVLVFLTMLFFIDLTYLWNRITPMLLISAFLLFFSRQCLVRSYQNKCTSATSISTLIYTKLGWTLLFSYFFWGSLPEPLEWLGVILIIISSWIIVFRTSMSPWFSKMGHSKTNEKLVFFNLLENIFINHNQIYKKILKLVLHLKLFYVIKIKINFSYL